jgi:hypothetical protein
VPQAFRNVLCVTDANNDRSRSVPLAEHISGLSPARTIPSDAFRVLRLKKAALALRDSVDTDQNPRGQRMFLSQRS